MLRNLILKLINKADSWGRKRDIELSIVPYKELLKLYGELNIIVCSLPYHLKDLIKPRMSGYVHGNKVSLWANLTTYQIGQLISWFTSSSNYICGKQLATWRLSVFHQLYLHNFTYNSIILSYGYWFRTDLLYKYKHGLQVLGLEI